MAESLVGCVRADDIDLLIASRRFDEVADVCDALELEVRSLQVSDQFILNRSKAFGRFLGTCTKLLSQGSLFCNLPPPVLRAGQAPFAPITFLQRCCFAVWVWPPFSSTASLGFLRATGCRLGEASLPRWPLCNSAARPHLQPQPVSFSRLIRLRTRDAGRGFFP